MVFYLMPPSLIRKYTLLLLLLLVAKLKSYFIPLMSVEISEGRLLLDVVRPRPQMSFLPRKQGPVFALNELN